MTLFISYAHKDEALRAELDAHLKLMQRTGLVQKWDDRLLKPGEEWRKGIDENLERTDIILLLVSADFLASDFCWQKEMERALERHQTGEARVIPVTIRNADWTQAKFAKLQALPKEGKAVTYGRIGTRPGPTSPRESGGWPRRSVQGVSTRERALPR